MLFSVSNIAVGETLWEVYNVDHSDDPEYSMADDEERLDMVEWFLENAEDIFAALREGNRLDWLRKNPESCRAAKDCRNKRAPGYIHCATCLEDGNAGGYFDVYQHHYVAIYNERVAEMDAALYARLEDVERDIQRLLTSVDSRDPIRSPDASVPPQAEA